MAYIREKIYQKNIHAIFAISFPKYIYIPLFRYKKVLNSNNEMFIHDNVIK